MNVGRQARVGYLEELSSDLLFPEEQSNSQQGFPQIKNHSPKCPRGHSRINAKLDSTLKR